MGDVQEFFEDDEPVDKIVDAFNGGQQGLTGHSRGQTVYLASPVAPDPELPLVSEPTNETAGRIGV